MAPSARMRPVVRLAIVLGLFAVGSALADTPAQPQRPVVRFKRPFQPGLPDVGEQAIATIAGYQHLTGPQYRDLRNAADELLRRFPPEQHYFIGLGRDPAPIIAFLQNLGGKQLAMNFPASSNQSSNATQEILATYVQKLVPPEVLAGGRKIVFVDATSSGRALDYYVPRLVPSFNGLPVLKVAFGVTNGGILTNPGDKHVIPTSAFPEVDQFYTGGYEEGIAEYPRHGPGTHPMSDIETPRAEYGQFREALRQRMVRDPELDGFLKSLPTFGDE